MSDNAKPHRDWIDYTDLLVKILGGGILVAVISILNTTNQLKQQEISNSLKYGEFTKSLMQDLLTQDSTHLKSDVALIILNRTIGDKDSKLIADMGARIIENFLEDKVHSDRSTMRTIISIIKERDTTTFKTVKALIDGSNANLRVVANVDETKKVKDNLTTIANNISDKDWEKVTLLQSSATVFLQINKEVEDPSQKTESILNQLKVKGYNTPAVEVVTSFKFKNAVKYYYAEDEKAAKDVQLIAEKKINAPVSLIKLTSSKARRGLIELWCNY